MVGDLYELLEKVKPLPELDAIALPPELTTIDEVEVDLDEREPRCLRHDLLEPRSGQETIEQNQLWEAYRLTVVL